MSRDLRGALLAAASFVEGSADELIRLDGLAGDGDLGITMTAAAEALRDALDQAGGSEAPQLLRSVGLAIARRAPSTAGTLLATAFLAAARALTEGEWAAGGSLAEAFRAATVAVAERGKVSRGDRTMLDALAAASDAVSEASGRGVGAAEALREAANAARRAADETASMTPRAGRAAWLADRAAGHPDAGSVMVCLALEGAASYLEAETD